MSDLNPLAAAYGPATAQMTERLPPNVPLKRKFSPIPDAFQRDDLALDDVWPNQLQRPSVDWAALEQAWRVVILAEAGAGKTYELRAAAARLADEGKASFFIRLEDIDSAFDTAFEIGSAETFLTWEAGTAEAWFFLDSVDEMRLTNPRAFEDALGIFASRIARNRQRAHVYISSRPYAWRGGFDRALVDNLLPYAPDAYDNELSKSAAGANDTPDGDASFQLFLLGPLNDADVSLYARTRHTADVGAFSQEVQKAGLEALVRRPFDLEDLLATWRQDGSLPNRLSVLQTTIRRQVDSACHQPNVEIQIDDALAAAGLLAACSVLTGEANIQLPAHRHVGGIDPSLLLPDWPPEKTSALLSAGIFGDPIYGAVRFRHREIRELLAAQWFASKCQSQGGRTEINRLLFRSQYGISIIPPRLRPLFPWLVLFDDDIRARAFEISPEVALEGGDVGRLPAIARVDLLERVLANLGQPGLPSSGLDYQQVARIADPALGADIERLIDLYSTQDDAIFILARIVTQGQIGGVAKLLLPIALDTKRGIWARIVSAAAVMTTGTPVEAASLWEEVLKDESPIPRQLFAEIVEHAPANGDSVVPIVAGLGRLVPKDEHAVDPVPRALHAFVDKIPHDSRDDLSEVTLPLLKGLHGYLEREPWVERRQCHVSQAFQWLMPVALHCIERLVDVRSDASTDETVLRVLASAPLLSVFRSTSFDERKSTLKAKIPQWPELNDKLFWWIVEQRRANSADTSPVISEDWPMTWPGHFWGFDASSFERTVGWIGKAATEEDKALSLARAFRTFDENNRPEGWLHQLREAVASNPNLTENLRQKLDVTLTPEMAEFQLRESRRERKTRTLAQRADRDRQNYAKKLAARPQDIRSPPKLPLDAVSQGQWSLLQILQQMGDQSTRSKSIDWRALVHEFGEAVAEAFRDAATEKWRAYIPRLRSEGPSDDQIPGGLLFGMAGLEIDAGVDGTGLTVLPDNLVQQALRYAPHELNGFPRWLEPLFDARPNLVLPFLWRELEWELQASTTDQPLHYVLHDIVYYAPWIHAALGPKIGAWLRHHQAPNLTCLRYLRQILVSGGTSPHDLAGLAHAKVIDPATPVAHLPMYLAILVDADPATGVSLAESKLMGLADSQAKLFAEEFITALVGSHREAAASIGFYRRQPTYLKQLYVLSFRYVTTADDINRAGGGVYSPERRDHAQEARSMLLSMLSDIPGELAYRAILDLAEIHPEPEYRSWMLIKAREHAIADGDLSTWTTEDVAALSKRLAGWSGRNRRPNAEA